MISKGFGFVAFFASSLPYKPLTFQMPIIIIIIIIIIDKFWAEHYLTRQPIK